MTALADVLRAGYAEREIDAAIVETADAVTVTDAGYVLRLAATEPLTVKVEGHISREAYYALGLADEQTEGAISAALARRGRFVDAQQVRYSLAAIQAGRGPIYGRQEG